MVDFLFSLPNMPCSIKRSERIVLFPETEPGSVSGKEKFAINVVKEKIFIF